MLNLIKQANTLIELGELDKAEAVFKDACSRWPDNTSILTGYARVAMLQRRWMEALERWRRVQEVLPESPWASIGQGNALIELGEFDKAEAVFKDARSRWPDNSSVLTGYARVAMLQRRWMEALELSLIHISEHTILKTRSIIQSNA